MFNVVFLADYDDRMHLVFRFPGFDQWVVGELDAIVGEELPNLEGALRQHLSQESGGGVSLLWHIYYSVSIHFR